MLRTMELILGLPPMSQYDAAATPMYGAFKATPDLAAFTRRAPRVAARREERAERAGAPPPRVAMNLDERGPRARPRAQRDHLEVGPGSGSPMPPPVRAAFVKRRAEKDE